MDDLAIELNKTTAIRIETIEGLVRFMWKYRQSTYTGSATDDLIQAYLGALEATLIKEGL